MRKFWSITFMLVFVACDFSASKDKQARELVNQEMRNIDWNDVDAYPLFENCDETLTKDGQRECFVNEVISHFSATLKEFEFILQENVASTVYVDFIVDREGKISVQKIEKDRFIDMQMPEFDGIITQSLKGLPPLAPALKRGIPVKTKFRIPIQLNTK
ncbi:hypothetical protein [Maribacter halichondriae]|uniref:hypothetical protein n=1 Tax=Maribacter halichondriae TaxID=2980554 RepID=UPI0023593BC5|nr:hypothetical protein [Maribacter sp. Hal144]